MLDLICGRSMSNIPFGHAGDKIPLPAETGRGKEIVHREKITVRTDPFYARTFYRLYPSQIRIYQ